MLTGGSHGGAVLPAAEVEHRAQALRPDDLVEAGRRARLHGGHDQLAGLLGAFAGMVFGSLAPQYIANEHEDVVHYQGSAE